MLKVDQKDVRYSQGQGSNKRGHMRTVFRATLRKLFEEATSLQDISKCDFIHPAFVFKADRLISRYCIPSRNKKHC